jgi:hypothetical protein
MLKNIIYMEMGNNENATPVGVNLGQSVGRGLLFPLLDRCGTRANFSLFGSATG